MQGWLSAADLRLGSIGAAASVGTSCTVGRPPDWMSTEASKSPPGALLNSGLL